ncbi:EAL domain-containing protein [Vibrio sp. SCSIO 43132]|uniref:EAL domain-containing protein n=1 Tax=Vibrio sp. SCSIO 43132 TaxID=2779363 RepID=UPI001CA91027|nr:EAL domain-containing protein [Vibrio sp. SCSIO 43132]UAB72454.1 EAL domain-containing protein [Vibrio sp. SCSIO 43132]
MILSNSENFTLCLKQDESGEHYAEYEDFVLKSVFQPIFNAGKDIIGFEALVRISNQQGETIRPDLFFHTNTFSIETRIDVEALSRAIHILNFAQSKHRKKQLFLNALPDPEHNMFHDLSSALLVSHLDELKIRTRQIVIEFVELQVNDNSMLSRVTSLLTQSGFGIAVDDYGQQASTKDRVKLLNPSIVKIDKSLMDDFMRGIASPLLSALSVATEVGAKTVIEGIESNEQFENMVSLNIDMFQGYHLAHPQPLYSVR